MKQEMGATSGKRRAFYEALRKTLELEVVKLASETSVRIVKMSVKTLYRSWPPPKRKKRLLAA
jgi:hypothetical protein